MAWIRRLLLREERLSKECNPTKSLTTHVSFSPLCLGRVDTSRCISGLFDEMGVLGIQGFFQFACEIQIQTHCEGTAFSFLADLFPCLFHFFPRSSFNRLHVIRPLHPRFSSWL